MRIGLGYRRWSVFLCCVAVLTSSVAGAALASDRETEGCTGWLPDFGCEASGVYPGFTMPMSMPYLFEHPFVVTSLQAVGIWQEFPQRSIFEGGYIDVAALQIRVALTDRLGFIAVRDGYAWFNPDLGIVNHERGFADMSFGFKYALIDRPDDGFILSPSLRFETDFGDHDLFQGMGDGIVIPGVSFGWTAADRVHVLGALGAQLPLDGGANSSYVHYNLHVDYALTPRLSPFVELSGIHITSDGDGSTRVHLKDGTRLTLSQAQSVLRTGSFEGFDFANLGSEGVSGQDVITAAIGMRMAVGRRLSLGLSYERPITARKDLLKQRVTLMTTYEF